MRGQRQLVFHCEASRPGYLPQGGFKGFIRPNDFKHRNHLQEQAKAVLFGGEADKAEGYMPPED